MKSAVVLNTSRRLLRSTVLRWASGVMAVVVTGLIALFAGQSAFTLSGEQVAERDFGTFQFSLRLPSDTPATHRSNELAVAVTAATRAGARDVTTRVVSMDLSPALPGMPSATYLEADWGAESFPDRFRLLSGRWPAAAGEVAVTAPLVTEGAAPEAAALSLLSGLAEVRAVGVVEDRYGKNLGRLLAAPGTFASFDTEQIDRKFVALDLRGELLWNYGEPERVADAIAEALPGAAEARTESRAHVAATQRKSFASSYPLGWKIPALALPFLVTVTAFGTSAQRLRRSMDILRSVGLGRRQITASVSIAAATLVFASAVMGVAFGALLGFGIRPLLTRFTAAPLAPFPDLTGTVVLLLVMTSAGCVVGTGLVHFGQVRRERSMVAPQRAAVPLTVSQTGVARAARRGARFGQRIRLGAVIALGACAVLTSGLPLDSVAAAMMWIGALTLGLLLLVPEAVTLALRFLPGGRPSTRLAQRHMTANRNRTNATVSVMAAAWALPLAFAAVLATMLTTLEGDQVANAGVDQVRILSEGSQPPPEESVRVVAEAVGEETEAPVVVHEIETQDDYLGIPVLGIGGVATVASAADLARLNGRALTAVQRETLEAGGVLHTHTSSHRRLDLAFTNGKTVASLPAHPIALDPVWSTSYAGYVLTETARDLDLPLIVSDVVFTGLAAQERQRVDLAVSTSGTDPYFVKVFHSPKPLRAPPAFYLALLALSLIVVGVSLAMVRIQVAALRRVLGSLIAVGIPASWARRVVFAELGVTTAVAGVMALLVAGPITGFAMARLPGFENATPWNWFMLIASSCVCSTVLAALLGTARLRPSDRTSI